MVRHSHQDALDEQTFDELVDAAADLDEPFDAECMFILVAGGRLGMRAGEISHMRESWIDREKQQIRIPHYQDCESGKNGEVCGYCRKAAKQQLGYGVVDSLEEGLDNRWEPKTSNSARTIPYDFSEFVISVIEAFFDSRDRYPHSRVSINRRVTRVAEAAGIEPEYCYPHCLRATAASWHAFEGLPAPALQALLGWSNLHVAEKYIRLSGGATAKALRDVHSD